MKLILAPLLMIGICIQANPIKPETLRTMYFEGWQEECGAKSLVDSLEAVGPGDDAILLAYKGAATTTLANCKFNPLGKLSVFNKGKDMIEAAVEKESQNVEIRFLRFTVQSNIPGLLNYDNMEADRKFIMEKLTLQPGQINSYIRKQMVSYLIKHGDLSDEEQKQLLELKAER